MKVQLITKNADGKAVKRNFNKVSDQITSGTIKSTAQSIGALLSGETMDKVNITTNRSVQL